MVVRSRPATNSACTGAMCGADSSPTVAIAFMRVAFQKPTNSAARSCRSAAIEGVADGRTGAGAAAIDDRLQGVEHRRRPGGRIFVVGRCGRDR